MVTEKTDSKLNSGRCGGSLLILALRKQRQGDLCEFKATPVYIASYRTIVGASQ